MRNRHNTYNKLKLKRPQPGSEQSFLFTTLVQQNNSETGKITEQVYEREVDIVYEGVHQGISCYRLMYLNADFRLQGIFRAEERLLKKISFVFDHLLLGVHADGRILTIMNMDELNSRWQEAKSEILEQYEGDYIIHYTAGIDGLMKDEAQVIAYLQQPAMYGNYFNGLWRTYHYGEAAGNSVQYGREAEGITINEQVVCRLPEQKTEEEQQVVELLITTENNLPEEYSGYFRYFNGLLQQANRKVAINNSEITYTIQWTGLQPIMN